MKPSIPQRFQVICIALMLSHTHAEQTASFTEIAEKTLAPLTVFIHLLHKVCWIIGGAFVIGACIQYLHRRHNPGQTPISQPIILALIGLVLIMLPFITQNLR